MGQWLPLLVNASADLYAAIWQETQFLGVAGVLESEPTEIEYMTIEEMLRVHSAAFAEGAYFVDGGELEVDDDAFDQIFLRVTGRAPLF
ncbi:hypothetical protein SSPS47_14020 [Streptomyces sp. S4.7]|nr:hypothetical protein SSPS47_14020 [Streptomyces sp. S4.7]